MTPIVPKQQQDKLMLILHLERTAPLVQPSAALENSSRARGAIGALAALFTARNGAKVKRLAAIIWLVVAAGCSGGDGDRLRVYPVRGEVLIDGKPASGAFVVLHPKGTAKPDAVRPRGYVRDDGSFELSSYNSNDARPEGEYSVTIELREMVRKNNDAWAGPNVLPAKYARPTTSPVSVRVARGSNELAPIIVKK